MQILLFSCFFLFLQLMENASEVQLYLDNRHKSRDSKTDDNSTACTLSWETPNGHKEMTGVIDISIL